MKYKYGALSTYICRDDYQEVLDILAHDKSLNVMHKEGKFFNIAVESNSYNIVEALLHYFEENQLKLCKDEYARLSLKQKMLDIIEIAIEDNNLSKEMQSVLSPYLRVEEEYSEDTSIEDNTFNFTEEEDDLTNSQNEAGNNHNLEIFNDSYNSDSSLHSKLTGDYHSMEPSHLN